MSFGRFFLHSLLLLAVCALFAYVYLLNPDNGDQALSIIIGMALSYAASLMAFAGLSWGFRRSPKKFMVSVFGSTIFSFLLIFAFLFLLIGAIQIDSVALIASLLATYVVFLGLKVITVYLHANSEGES